MLALIEDVVGQPSTMLPPKAVGAARATPQRAATMAMADKSWFFINYRLAVRCSSCAEQAGREHIYHSLYWHLIISLIAP